MHMMNISIVGYPSELGLELVRFFTRKEVTFRNRYKELVRKLSIEITV